MKRKIVKIKIKSIKLRNNWGKVKPYTRIEEDKSKFNRKEKHKKDFKK